ncbi:MAG: NnrS family protein [Magnetococcales bacterium]|nr:NnrS family protein [Magnetococcales bacterium]
MKSVSLHLKAAGSAAPAPPTPQGPIALVYGFRAFFLPALLWSVVAMGLWLGLFSGELVWSGALSPSAWHGHEMLFGALAGLASGFLLTAVANWTGQPPFRGWPLALLLFGWLAGRFMVGFAALFPPWLVAVVDGSYLFVFAVILFWPMARTRLWIHAVFPPLFVLWGLGNLLFHLDGLGLLHGGATLGLRLGVDALLWIIVILAGRMFVNFTKSALPPAEQAGFRPPPVVEMAAHLAMAGVILADLLAPDSRLSGAVLLGVGGVHLVRLMGWRSVRVAHVPMVWVLHLGYLWLALGYLLRGAALLWAVLPETTAWHAHTVGALGLIAAGIVPRVSMAHTGRPVAMQRLLWPVFLLLAGAVLVRLAGASYAVGILGSGVLWMAAFSLEAFLLWPMLTRPRIDGRPG